MIDVDLYTPEHMTFTVKSINTKWWLDFILEMIAHSEWVCNARVIYKTDDSWMLEIIDDEYDSHKVSDKDLLENLQKSWEIGDRMFLYPENIDFDVIDGIMQELCFGKLVYG